MKLIKENIKGKTYQGDGFKVLYRNRGSISGDNENNHKEIIYLITGKASLTLGDKEWEVTAPTRFIFSEKTYHKIEAITDISMILIEE
jgi:hypothetical protein